QSVDVLIHREAIAIDDDADIGLLRLREPARMKPFELEPDVRQGQSWQAFPSGTRIVGTIATAWPGITIRMPAHVTTPLPSGTPIFSGTKVIGHVGSEPPSNGIIHIVSARLIQWWLAEVDKVHPPPTEQAQSSTEDNAFDDSFSANV